MATKKPHIVIVSQVYVPDPTAVGQYMADAAEALVLRGCDVTVITSGRGYEDPSIKYPRRESRGGVQIERLGFSSFGKKTIFHRLLGHAFFLGQVLLKCLFRRRLDVLLVSTSPPMCSVIAIIVHWLRRVPIKFWVMDINPDQVIALGKVKADSFAAKAFNFLNRTILKASEDVIVLDRFMADRMDAKRPCREKMHVIPPWPMEDQVAPVDDAENPFITEHNLQDKFVVMYSGNHGLSTPLETLVDAALQLQDHPRLLFLFVGGGLGKACVEQAIQEHNPQNIVSLPYQPLESIRYSLSAADLHVASLVDPLVGVLHPCKIYGAMAVARPILWFGPQPSHATDIIDQYDIGWRIPHGETKQAAQLLTDIAAMDEDDLHSMGQRARDVLQQSYSKEKLCGEFCRLMMRSLDVPATSEPTNDMPDSAPTMQTSGTEPASSA